MSASTTPGFSLAAGRYAADTRQAAHSHDELQVTLLLAGSVEERVGARLERATALSVVVKDPGVLHADHFGTAGAATARLALDRTTLAGLVEHPSRALAWTWVHDTRIAAPFLRLLDRSRVGESRFATNDDDIVDLVAAITARPDTAPTGDAPRWLQELLARVHEGWQPGLSVRALADESGMHPVYLARCVRRWRGVGAADLLRRARLREASRRVADGDARLATIAHATGFADEAHLCRTFRSATGLSPARFRRLSREFGERFRGFKSGAEGRATFGG